MFGVIIILVVLVLFVLIYFENYIIYFFRLVKRDLVHNKKLRELTHKNIKKRLCSNQILENYTNKVNSELKKIGYNGKSEYKVNEEILQKIRFSNIDDKIVNEIINDIFKYLKLDISNIKFEIQKVSSRKQGNAAGIYDSIAKKITIKINPYCDLNRVVAVLAHETSHYLLLSNKIEIQDRDSNEVLTDITAIYLGFGEYMYNSYKDNSRIIYEGEFTELIDRHKLGYLADGDIKFVRKIIEKLNKI